MHFYTEILQYKFICSPKQFFTQLIRVCRTSDVRIFLKQLLPKNHHVKIDQILKEAFLNDAFSYLINSLSWPL